MATVNEDDEPLVVLFQAPTRKNGMLIVADTVVRENEKHRVMRFFSNDKLGYFSDHIQSEMILKQSTNGSVTVDPSQLVVAYHRMFFLTFLKHLRKRDGMAWIYQSLVRTLSLNHCDWARRYFSLTPKAEPKSVCSYSAQSKKNECKAEKRSKVGGSSVSVTCNSDLHVFVIGVGGGAFPAFLNYYLGTCQQNLSMSKAKVPLEKSVESAHVSSGPLNFHILGVDIDPGVLAVRQKFFSNNSGERLRYVVADGVACVNNFSQIDGGAFDFIFIDVNQQCSALPFTAHFKPSCDEAVAPTVISSAPPVTAQPLRQQSSAPCRSSMELDAPSENFVSESFLVSANKSLKSAGLLVLNVLGHPRAMLEIAQRCQRLFTTVELWQVCAGIPKVIKPTEIGRGNLIVTCRQHNNT